MLINFILMKYLIKNVKNKGRVRHLPDSPAEAQLAINELQIDDIQDAKYEIAKNINKITTKRTQNPTKEERQKLKTLQNVKRKLKNNNIIHVKADKGNGQDIHSNKN